MNPVKLLKSLFTSVPRQAPLDCAHRVRSGEAFLVDVRLAMLHALLWPSKSEGMIPHQQLHCTWQERGADPVTRHESGWTAAGCYGLPER